MMPVLVLADANSPPPPVILDNVVGAIRSCFTVSTDMRQSDALVEAVVEIQQKFYKTKTKISVFCSFIHNVDK